MLLRILSLSVLVGLAWPVSAEAQTFVSIPGTSVVNDVTPDGAIIVGAGNGGGFYWNWKADPAPTFIGGNDATGVSDDGTVIVGCITDPVLNAEVAARWTAATGWESLGYLPNALSCPSRSNAYDVSGDGNTVVGLSWDGCNGRGFLWTEATGMQELEVLANARNRATTISGDGSAIGGFAQGNFSRTPAYWAPDTSGFVLDADLNGEVYGFTEDGSLSVGTMEGEAYYRTSTGTVTMLGMLNSGWTGHAYDISEDGNTIVGLDTLQTALEGWIWTPATGIVSFADVLSLLNVPNAPSSVYACTAVSDDGNVVVGIASPGIFGTGFVAELSDSPWTNVGGGSPGINGTPILSGTGSLVGGAPAGLELVNARESTLTVAWLSLNPTPFDALDGTVQAFPYNNQFLFNTDPTGSLSLNTTWPVGLPAGINAWFQFLIADSSSIHGIVMSNGLKATTP